MVSEGQSHENIFSYYRSWMLGGVGGSSSIMSRRAMQALYGHLEQLPSFIGDLLAKMSAQSGGIPNPVIWSNDWQVHF